MGEKLYLKIHTLINSILDFEISFVFHLKSKKYDIFCSYEFENVNRAILKWQILLYVFFIPFLPPIVAVDTLQPTKTILIESYLIADLGTLTIVKHVRSNKFHLLPNLLLFTTKDGKTYQNFTWIYFVLNFMNIKSLCITADNPDHDLLLSCWSRDITSFKHVHVNVMGNIWKCLIAKSQLYKWLHISATNQSIDPGS